MLTCLETRPMFDITAPSLDGDGPKARTRQSCSHPRPGWQVGNNNLACSRANCTRTYMHRLTRHARGREGFAFAQLRDRVVMHGRESYWAKSRPHLTVSNTVAAVPGSQEKQCRIKRQLKIAVCVVTTSWLTKTCIRILLVCRGKPGTMLHLIDLPIPLLVG